MLLLNFCSDLFTSFKVPWFCKEDSSAKYKVTDSRTVELIEHLILEEMLHFYTVVDARERQRNR